MTEFVSADVIRASFANAMSDMYREEVPLYAELIGIVASVNDDVLRNDESLRVSLTRNGGLGRLGAERHGAVRVGTARELFDLRRVFAVMGMQPVGYYDLAVAGIPVHSTAFRPVDPSALTANPFRVFTSLLRLELIEDADLRAQARDILSTRKILSDRAIELVANFEEAGGLDWTAANELISEVLKTFKWHHDADVDQHTYKRLHDAHGLIADVVCFRGPHINHLTPRTLDIDRAQAEMLRRGIDAKVVIEGPPRRAVPILLRQTSFKALEEPIGFLDTGFGRQGTHTARFGEIEQRGAALTPKGRALYDECLDEARNLSDSQGEDYHKLLAAAFARFPDDLDVLRRDRLVFFRYAQTDAGRKASWHGLAADNDLEGWLEAGWVSAEPIVYEDFLPVSAAGIFRSNLNGREERAYAVEASQQFFEEAIGVPVLDPFTLYGAIEASSRNAVQACFRTGARTSST